MRKKIGIAIVVLVFWVLLWQIISMITAQEILVPSPFAMLRSLANLMVKAAFWQAVALSVLRVICGFVGGVICGVLLAVLTVRFRFLHSLFAPVLQCIKAAPVASFIILALVWIPTDFLPVFICFLMVLPIVWNNVQEGIRQTDSKLLEMAQVFGFGGWKTLVKVRIPAVMPYLMTALTTGLGFAWKSGIAAEVICQPGFAIGKQLYFSKLYLETPQVFAWTAVVVVLSVGLEKILKKSVVKVAEKYGVQGKGEERV
jgi:NitT/TauT family transport system permease protein